PQTRPSLLARIRDRQDARAWAEFVEVYAPLVYGFACRQGLQDADAADLTQEVLRAVARAAAHPDYDPRRGGFRGRPFTVARRARPRPPAGRGASDGHRRIAQEPARADGADLWDREYEQRLFAWAAEQVRRDFQPATWQAFWLTAVEGKSGKEVAGLLGLS